MDSTRNQGQENGFRVAVKRFNEAVRNVFWYVAFGLSVGIGLVVLSLHAAEYLEPIFAPKSALPELGEKLLEHIGMGFVVAAIAVLFYEWGAHIKDTLRLSAELSSLTAAVEAKALDGVLKAYFQSGDARHDAELVKSVTDIVSSLRRLQEHGDWANSGYQRFIAAMVQKVSASAAGLADVSERLKLDGQSEPHCNIMVYTPAELTDKLLSEQMSRLPRGGSYLVASNPGSWRSGQLHELFTQSKIAVEARGVGIRRIFVLSHHGAHAGGAGLEEVREILEQHLAAAQSWRSTLAGGGYAVKLLDHVEVERLRMLPHDAAGEIFRNHFAVVQYPDSRYSVQVKANEPGLSELRVEGLREHSRELENFSIVWEELPDLDREQMDKVFHRWADAAEPEFSKISKEAGLTGVTERFPSELIIKGISQAKEVVKISTTWIHSMPNLEAALDQAVANSCNVEILLLDPKSEAARQRSKDLQFADPEAVPRHIDGTLDWLGRVLAAGERRNGNPPSIRTYSTAPTFLMYLFDDMLVYCPVLHGDKLACARRQFVVTGKATDLYKMMEEQFNLLAGRSVGYQARVVDS